jgi:putative membrane protein
MLCALCPYLMGRWLRRLELEGAVKKSLLLYVKGLAMGAVDVVPGFSGGTVALITGIYDKLLSSFSASPQALMLFLRGRIKDAWAVCNATFLLTVLLGVLTSVFTLARLISYLMLEHPVLLWSFFFGLVLVSVYLVGREVVLWSLSRLMVFASGLALAVWITLAAPLQLAADPLILFLAGAIAISAMILPGISGSFILVLLGLYPVVLGAVKNLDLVVLAVFSGGCVLGLMTFSRLLSWLLQHVRDITLAFLAGLMLGSLGKVWPWKQTLTWQTNSHGESYPLLQENLWPQQFADLLGQNPQLLSAIVLAIAGVVLVLGLEWLGKRSQPSA